MGAIMSKFDDAVRGFYFRKSKQEQLERALARIESAQQRSEQAIARIESAQRNSERAAAHAETEPARTCRPDHNDG